MDNYRGIKQETLSDRKRPRRAVTVLVHGSKTRRKDMLDS